MNTELFNTEYETIVEDVQILYQHFRKKGIQPSAASGRTLYELENDLKGRLDVTNIANLVLCELIMNDPDGERTLIEYYLGRIFRQTFDIAKFLIGIYEKLNESNRADFHRRLTDINQNLFESVAPTTFKRDPLLRYIQHSNMRIVSKRKQNSTFTATTQNLESSLVTMYMN